MSTRKRDIVKNFNIFFVTSTFKEWLPLLITEKHFMLLCNSLKFCLSKFYCDLFAYALMPNHVHFIIMFKKETKISEFMRDFKKYTSTQIRVLHQQDGNIEIIKKLIFERGEQKFKVWMDRFDLKIILSTKMLQTKVKYIHENPVKRGLVEKEEDWLYSSSSYYKYNIDYNLQVRNVGEIMF